MGAQNESLKSSERRGLAVCSRKGAAPVWEALSVEQLPTGHP